MDRPLPLARRESRSPNSLLTLGALILGLLGQFILHEGQVTVGAILTVLAAMFFVIAFWRQPGIEIRLNTAFWERWSLHPKSSFWGGVALGFAVISSGLAFWLFGEDIPAYYPWSLHRASIGLLIVSSFMLNRLGNPGSEKALAEGKGWRWLEAFILLGILAIAAFLRLYRSDEIPFGLWYDEADNGLSALAILESPESLPVFVKSTNLPAHFLYLIALSFQFLGVSVFAIRVVSVVFGLATVVVSYFLGSELFDRRLGLVFAFLIAVSRWDVNWSRIGMHGVSVPFFEILSCLLVLRSLRTQSLVYYTLAGLSLGLGLCFYTPLYFFPIVIAVFLLFLWTQRHELLTSYWRGFLFLALGFVIVSVPITQFAIRHTDSFDDRLRITSIFTGKSPQESWKAVARTTREHLLMFNYKGDRNGRHNLPGEPMLDTISGTLMVLGLALSLRRIRQPLSFLLVVWLLIMLLPGIFSLDFESPQSLRAIGSLPPAYLLALVPIHAVWQEWEKTPAVFVPLLVLVLALVGYVNYHIYFDLQSKRSDVWGVFSTPETIIGKTMAKLGPQVDIYLTKYFYYYSPTIQFLAPEIKEYNLLETDGKLPIPDKNGKAKVFFIDPNYESFFYQAREQHYPNATFNEYRAPNGAAILYQITLSP